jgi:predicted KAP-like P-loop ATPase
LGDDVAVSVPSFHHDRPSTDDRLNRADYTAAFANLIRTSDTPFVIGLYGSWGIGKTSLMNHIARELGNDVRSVTYNAWAHQSDQQPAVALLHELVDQLGLRGDRRMRKWLTVIGRALGGIGLAKVGASPADVERLAKEYDDRSFGVREAQVQLRATFGKFIQRAAVARPRRFGRTTLTEPRKIVFFIDDLDRCMPDAVLNVLEALKIYLDLPGCVYVLALDRQVVERSVLRRYDSMGVNAANYLEKIVQLPFEIPMVSTEAVETFVDLLVPEQLHETRSVLIAGLGANPRQIKRFVNGLTFNHHLAIRSDIEDYDPVVLAALLLIQHRDPVLYREVQKRPERLDAETISEDEDLCAGLTAASGRLSSTTPALKDYFHLTRIAGMSPFDRLAAAVPPEPIDVSRFLQEGARGQMVADIMRGQLPAEEP